MNKIADRNIAAQIAEALGLPKTTAWFELRCAVGEPVIVRCGYYPEIKAPLIEALAEYELHPK